MKSKKTSTKRKIAFSCIAIILFFIACQIFSVFILGVGIAERKLSEYAKEVLKLNEKIECQYDWYNNRYFATNELGFILDYRRQNNTILDESFSQKESEKANYNYNALIGRMPDNLTLPPNIMVWTEISADNYNLKAQRLYLLGIFNTEDISEQDSFQKPADIAMDIILQLGESYNFTGIQAIYFDKNGMFEIVIPARSLEPMTAKILLGNTKQAPTARHPEHYTAWLAENNF